MILNFFEFIEYLNLENFKIVVRNIKLLDILDILIVFLIIYSFLLFLKRIRYLSLIIVTALLFVIYFLSYWLGLVLSYKIINNFLSVFLIFLVVVFQDEIKRLFFLAANFKLKKRRKLTEENIKKIIQSLEILKNTQTGALIIFEGEEKLDNYIKDSIELNSEISPAIITFIFNTSSPLHDGAIIIKNNKIREAKVTLPLSENYPSELNGGTRHRAGLGITEKTDCLSIIVSEERGTVSVAQNGNIKLVDNIREIESILNDFYKKTENKMKANKFVVIKSNLLIGIISLTISFIMWFYISLPSLGFIQKTFTSQLEFINLSNDLKIEEVKPKEVILTFMGRKKDFDMLSSGNIKIKIDLKDYQEAKTYFYEISKKDISFSQNLELIDISPEKIRIKIEKIIMETSTQQIKENEKINSSQKNKN